MIIQQIIFGFIAVVLGVVSIKYNYQLVGMTGNVQFFERYLGGGGTYFGFKLLSIILITAGLLYMTGLGTPVAHILLDPLLRLFSPSRK